VVAKTDSTGSLTYQAQYEAFGKQTATTGSTLDRQKSNSKDTDPTGLVDEGFRYRDLETGMFFTRDPAGFIDGPNLYTYVIQNPWTHFDPEGLATEQQYQDDEDQHAAHEKQVEQDYWKNNPNHPKDPSQDKKLQGLISADEAAIAKDKKGIDNIEATAKQINEAAGREFIKASEINDDPNNEQYKHLQNITKLLDVLSVDEFALAAITPSRKVTAVTGAVGLDTNAIIALLEGSKADSQAVLTAIGDRLPQVSITAIKEFLAGGGDVNLLRTFLKSSGGGVAPAASQATVQALRRAGLKAADASVVGSARDAGTTVITRDKEILKKASGDAETF
jgi:RHS repeat-associated protein